MRPSSDSTLPLQKRRWGSSRFPSRPWWSTLRPTTPERKEPPLAKACKLTESQIPECRTQSLCADVIADFTAQGA